MDFSIFVKGDRELIKKLKFLPAKIHKKGTRKATREAAKSIILPDAKRYAPHDEGRLERELTVRVAKKTNGKRLSRHVMGHAVSTRTRDVFYGMFQDLGTRQRRTKQGANRGKIEPREFMREALFTNRRPALQSFKNTLRAALKVVAK